jgi:hypothetical protein
MKAALARQPVPKAAPAARRARAIGAKPLRMSRQLFSRPVLSHCACGGSCPRCKNTLPIQTKLAVSQPGDSLEQQADRVADQIMRMPAGEVSAISRGKPSLQRKCVACEEEDEKQILQRKDAASGVTAQAQISMAPSSVSEAVNSPGQPLSNEARAFFEPRFGHDFSGVRVHSGAAAARSAHDVAAKAYTVGHNIVFSAGQYAPGTNEGERLLAHELTHVLQQQSGGAVLLQRQSAGVLHSCREGEGPPAAESDPEGKGPHPLIYRGETKKRSRRAGVGDAQQLLNRFLTQLKKEEFKCKPGADMDGIAAIRASLKQDPLEVDCRFGPNTEKATLMFQRCVFPEERKEWDGKIGPNTWRELDKLRAPIPFEVPPIPFEVPPIPKEPVEGKCKLPTNPDLSGSDFNPTTMGQVSACLSVHSTVCRAWEDDADEANKKADRSGLPGTPFGPRDAFRHSLWNCLMTQDTRTGLDFAERSKLAERIATAHENDARGKAGSLDIDMDLHNNATGRKLGALGKDCVAECRRALEQGELRTLRGLEADNVARGEKLPPASPTVVPTCLGASDQPWP